MFDRRMDWWKHAVVYQIYPRSFKDSHGDGNGDLRGIIEKLGYIESLGVDAVWLSPIYASPMIDNGYDVSDYYAINPMFGTSEDFDALVAGLHERGIRLLMDLVVNHTSDQHSWFIESRSSRENPKRDWYLWHPGRDGNEPNNWASHFGGSAWEKDAATGEYYLHLFAKQQPDLNWRNPEVQTAVFDMMRWWLDKGVDGFRIDMGNFFLKDPALPDARRDPWDTSPFVHPKELCANQPGMHEIYQAMHDEVLAPYDAVAFGEMYFLNPDTARQYVGWDRKEIQLLYQYPIMDARGNWQQVRREVQAWYDAFRGGATNTITFSNHDSGRSVSVFGDDTTYHDKSAQCIATYLLSAPGTAFFLQGEEIGMTNVLFPSIDDYTDIEMQGRYADLMSQGADPNVVLPELIRWSRDNARTPMQWANDVHAGFSTHTPWLAVNPRYTSINVDNQEQDKISILNYYRQLIALRNEVGPLKYGTYAPLVPMEWETFAIRRDFEGETIVCIYNFLSEEMYMHKPDVLVGRKLVMLLSNYEESGDDTDSTLRLRPWEARIMRIVT